MRFRKSYIIMPVVVLMVILCIRVVYLMNTHSPARRHRAAGWHKPIASTRPTADSTEPTPLIGQSSDYDVAQLAANTGNRLAMTSSRSGSRVSPAQRRRESEMVVVVVACMMRLSETLNMIKSALIFHVDRRPLRFVVITEASLMQAFSEKLEDWQTATKYAFEFDILPLKFPEVNTKEWRDLFKPCASQRLFLPVSPGDWFVFKMFGRPRLCNRIELIRNIRLQNLLTTTDAVLYVDTDTVFLSPVSRIWSLFAQFNATQMAGLSPEHEDKNVGWYNRFARHPFYGPLGVNSGVMLMNLTRMRSFKWVDYILPLHKEYKLKITWGDQDLINILFHFHPGRSNIACDKGALNSSIDHQLC